MSLDGSVNHQSSPAPSVASTTVSRRGRGGRGGRRGGGAVGRTAAAEAITDESSLFSMVKGGRSLHAIIDKWIEEYDRHPDNALVQLQQFFVSCSGCKGVISSVMIQKMDYKDIIRRLTEEFDEESGDYPLVMSGPQWRKFKTNFPEFVSLLITKCKSNIVFDSKTMDGLIQLLTGLADSQVRAFRHTATFAAMKLSTALVSIACEHVKMRELNGKQIETEKSKVKKATSERIQQLLEKKADLEEHINDVRLMIQYVFKSVFVHRYRDIVPEIRAVCIEELGNWMFLFPDQFLDDSYLKYIGWMLYDKNPDVRIRCLAALIPLYERPELATTLELFTAKFRDRLVGMVRDKDYDVAIKACHLMTCVYNILPQILDIHSCEPIYELVYCSHRGIAIAAGEFLNAKVFCGGDDFDRKKLLSILVDFFIEGQLHTHAAYLVDSLIDTNPIIKDFGTMGELLASNESDGIASQLIEIMSCAVRQASTGKSPAGRSQHHHRRGGVAVPPREARLLQEDRTKMTEDLIPVLPQLIMKFVADQEALENLCDLPRYFILEMYLAGRQEKYLADLMTALELVVERHTDSELLLVVARTLGALLQNANIATYTETARHRIIDTIAVQLRAEIQRFQSDMSVDEEDSAALLACMRKISVFASTQDLSQWDLWNPVLSVVSGGEDKVPSRDVAEHAVQFLFLSLSHDFSLLYTKLEENPDEDVMEAVRVIRTRRDQFLNIVETILRSGAAGVENAFLCVCDLLILFSWRLRQRNASLGPLVVNVTSDLIHQMDCFVVDNVFVEEEEDDENDDAFNEQQRVELMHKRRNLLAQFCKLIMYNVIPLSHMWVVLKHYERFYRDFGDIIKNMIHKVRDLHKLQCAHGVANALTDDYKCIRNAVGDGTIDPLSDEFMALRDLAKKLAQSFGSDHVKNRDVIAGIHREGILFALNDKREEDAIGENGRSRNLLFLEALLEFSSKLLKQDRACVLNYLEKQVDPTSVTVSEDYWQPYILYKGSLQERAVDDNASVRSGPSPTPRRRSARVRKNTESEED
ncbi:hypothetical protein QR680_017716 [Steinernema hermaphroditum]|uniref:SCD domain-containing protein n=1 Tax=Steinernema hermaphroditum TaxID=289476 RepID=A0AA39LPL8_9BILA|nr:hypothetical protein QR680_017716 [Steinernema hermaphroditum]